MFHTQILIFHGICAVLSVEYDLAEGGVGHDLGRISLGESVKLAFGHRPYLVKIRAYFLEDQHCNTIIIAANRTEQVKRSKNRMRFGHSDLLSGRQGLLCFHRELIEFHFLFLLSEKSLYFYRLIMSKRRAQRVFALKSSSNIDLRKF